MRLKLALPVLGALALMAALPDTAEARRRRSSFDVSVGFGHSSYGGHRGYGRSYHDSGVSFRYSRGYDRGYSRGYGYGRSRHYDRGYDRPRYYHYDRPRYYAPRPVYRSYHYSPRRYYREDYGYGYHGRPLYRSYYYRDYDYCY